jgi:xanthine dehydrogenase accessory factor
MNFRTQLQRAVAEEGRAAVVTLAKTEGSTPRDTGAWMIVRPSGGFHGTVGGGALEWSLLQQALSHLSGDKGVHTFSHSLGPDLGQCCGGRVRGKIVVVDAGDISDIADPTYDHEWAEDIYEEARTPLYLFGAGHVGRALVLALANLPFDVRWIDERADMFPAAMPSNVMPVNTSNPVAEIAAAPAGAFILIMTHSHALDLDLVAEALRQRHFPYIGLIGSGTKKARFVSRLRTAGFDDATIGQMTCPIGIAGLKGKEPAVIAASVAAQLLMMRTNECAQPLHA